MPELTPRKGLIIAIGIFVFHACLVWLKMRRYLDDQVINAFDPSGTDAPGYVMRAMHIAHGQWVEALHDGYRTPGYPTFLALCMLFSPTPLAMARTIQLILNSAMIVVIYLLILRITRSPRAGLLGSVLCALWVPLHYFSPVLYAESLSLCFSCLFLYALSFVEEKVWMRTVLIATTLLMATVYLKPNNIALYLLFVAYAATTLRPAIFRRALALSVATIVALMLPWSLFISTQNRMFIPFSTTLGVNLYLGTGAERDIVHGNLDSRYAEKAGLAIVAHKEEIAPPQATAAELNKFYTHEAVLRWKAQPAPILIYGLLKIGHSVGLSLRGGKDVLVLGITLLSLASAVYLWRSRRYAPWQAVYWAALAVMLLQTLAFLSNLRFRVVLLDLPCLIVTTLALSVILLRGNAAESETEAA